MNTGKTPFCKGSREKRSKRQKTSACPRITQRHLSELVTKYKKDSIVANVPRSKHLSGTKLEGKYILEVPVQNKPIPQAVLERATKLEILIRDIEIKEYNTIP